MTGGEPADGSTEGQEGQRSFRSKIFSATLWTLLLRILVRTVGVGSTLVVARYVPQTEIGAFGALTILDGGLVAFSGIGFSSAIIQMKKDPTPYYDTTWTTDVLRAVVIYALEFSVAPAWCGFFHIPEATTALRVLALGQLILGFHSISTAVLMRDLKFGRLFFTYLSESLTYSIVTIAGAIYLRNMWALVIGVVAGFTVRVIVSYFVSPVRARFSFDLAKAREMFAFTKWILAYGVVDFLLETGDNATTGRMLGRKQLAHYRMAYQLATEGSVTIQYVVTRVALPAFSAIQMKPESIRLNFRATIGLVALTMIPASLAIFFFSDAIVTILLGPSWLPAATALRILAFAALCRSIIDVAPPVLRALGHTRRDFILKVFQVGLMGVLLYPAAKWFGLQGVAWAVVLAAFLTLPLWLFILRRAAGFGLGDFGVPVIAPVIAGAATVGTHLIVAGIGAGWTALILSGVVFVVTYASATAILYRVIPGSGIGAVIHGTGR